MKKALIAVLALLVLIFGGLTVFVNTKSDFIIQKVSEVLEKNLHAKLEMAELPKISVFPSLSVSAGKSSLTSPDYTITFDSAAVNVSLFKLFSGTVQVNSVHLDSLDVKYVNTAKTAPEDGKAKSNDENEKSKSLEEIFALIPAEISVADSNIQYKDEQQEIQLSNINAQITDFGINKNSSVVLQGSAAFKDKTQDIAFDLTADVDFLFMGQSLEYDIKNFVFTPVKGLPVTHPVEVTAESSMNFAPLMIEKLDGVIKSPFANLTVKGKGDDQKGELNIDGELFALEIQKQLLPDMPFNNLPKSMKISAKISNTPKEITVHEALVNSHDGLIKISGLYSMAQKDLNAKIYAENLAVQDYLPKENNAKKDKSSAKPAKKTAAKQTGKKDSTNLTFNITADAAKIRYNNYVIDAVHSIAEGKITDKEKIITIKPLTVTKENETINLSAKLELEPKDLITVSLDGKNLDAKKWTKGLAEKAPLDAKISAASTLSFKSADPLNTLNGSGRIDGSALRIETKLLPFITNLLQLNFKLQDFYEFTVLKAPFTVKNGLLATPNTYVDSSAILVTANGNTHLARQSLNFAGNAELKNQGLVFPYKVSGTYADPKFGLDLGKQLEVLGKGILNTGGAIGSGVVEGGKTVGGGVVEGGKAIGGGLVEGGKLIEKGLGKLFQ